MANKVRITYNAPITLNFSLVCALVLIISRLIMPHLILVLFSAPARQGCPGAFNWTNPIHYLRLFTHVFGHAGWNHLVGNLAFILLLGPLLEERYGSRLLLLMIMVTAFVTGILNAVFLSTGLMGASGIAFMMILLSSFGSVQKDGIPLTFLLALIIYLGREVAAIFVDDNISNFAHIAGGLCGSIFGFAAAPIKRKRNAS